MRATAEFFQIQALADGDIPERIEEVDRQRELLIKELPHIWERGGAAANKHALRLAATLLGAIETDRSRNLRVKTRHGVADHLRNARGVGVIRIGVRAA